MSRPWTPAPWQVVDRDGIYTVTSPNGNPINCYEVCDTWRVKPDADLIALAPRMAEAILNYSYWNKILTGPNGDNEYDKAWIELDAVATELRKIIKEHEDA